MDCKPGLALGRIDIDTPIRMDLSHRRLVRARPQPEKKLVDLLPSPLQLDRYPPRIVKNRPG
jgi:hypothetical protein